MTAKLVTRAVLIAAVAASALAVGCATKTTASSSTSAPAGATNAPATTTPKPVAHPSEPASSTGHGNAAVRGTAPVAALPMDTPIATLPQPRPGKTISGPRTLGVPILMYHEIGTAPAGSSNPDLFVKPAEFADHLRWLITHGYHAVTLQQVYDFWQGKATLPSKPVVISFDDGDGSQWNFAAPLLNEVHWPGNLFLIVGKKHLRLKPGIVRALIAAGWEIDSHTISHEEVAGMPAKQLASEVAGSRQALRKLYGVPVNFFCYPSGRFDAPAIAEVQAAGYLGATTTLGGLARPGEGYVLRRVRVSGGESGAAVGSLVAEAR